MPTTPAAPASSSPPGGVAAASRVRDPFRLLPARGGAWRAQALIRRTELRGLADAFMEHEPPHPDCAGFVAAIDFHLQAAEQAITGEGIPGSNKVIGLIAGTSPEQAAGNLDKAELFLLRMAPQEYVIGQLPSLYAQVRTHLRPGDPRLDDMRRLVARYVPPVPDAPPSQEPLFATLTDNDREGIAANFDAKCSVARRDVGRVRSYRNILFLTAAALWIAVGVLTLVTFKHPNILPLCFMPGTTAVCPTHTGPQGGAAKLAAERKRPPYPGYRAVSKLNGSAADAREAGRAEVNDLVMRRTASRGDVALVELIGLLAAAVTATFALRNMSGSTTPYSLPIALAALKVPTGALTAVLGIVLLRGEFIPGLSALDSSGQILAWAAVFGAAQQAVTRLLDRKAQGVLDKVGAPGTEKAADGTTQTAPSAA
jgi:hypothetical protein